MRPLQSCVCGGLSLYPGVRTVDEWVEPNIWCFTMGAYPSEELMGRLRALAEDRLDWILIPINVRERQPLREAVHRVMVHR